MNCNADKKKNKKVYCLLITKIIKKNNLIEYSKRFTIRTSN